MKSRLITLCIILTLVVMFPVLAQAETKEEFELSCNMKTTSACTVYDSSAMNTVVASIPAGTYVHFKGGSVGDWTRIEFYHNGSILIGWAEVKLTQASSVVRKGDTAYNVHELDPDYDEKMQEGTVEVDARQGWSIYDNDPGKQHVSPEEAAARAGQYTTSGSTTAGNQYTTSGQRTTATGSTTTTGSTTSKSTTTTRTSTVPTVVTLKAKLRRVSGSETPADLLTAFVYAPNSGKASLREAADNDSKVLSQCTTGTVVTVLEIGKTHSRVDVDGQVGYLRNDCLGYSAVKEEQVLSGVLIGGGSVNVRGGADKDSYRIGQWPSGTQVTVYGVNGIWCEVEFDGVHGWVATKYVVPVQ